MKKEGKKKWRAKTFFKVITKLGGSGKTMKQIVEEYDLLASEYRGGSNSGESYNYVNIGVHILTEFGLMIEENNRLRYMVQHLKRTPVTPPPMVELSFGTGSSIYLKPGSKVRVTTDEDTGELSVKF